MAKQEYIYRVSFNEPPYDYCGEKCDFFFGSLSAIYEQFDHNDIGCKVETLWRHKITPDNPYRGRKCTITQEPVIRKKQEARK